MSEETMEAGEESPCQNCQDGHIPTGEHFVSHDMALDAGEPTMEGMSMGIEWGMGPCCNGIWQDCEACSVVATREG